MPSLSRTLFIYLLHYLEPISLSAIKLDSSTFVDWDEIK